ncbi:MAG: hypothetical protein JWO25_3767 [Alphaproteobacteria bacterium]|nr:hypothetical protein [Alphaproteobacteria bacterium]MDB5720810.1 hypothetical protein [Alphaproteobacteria bacterium]
MDLSGAGWVVQTVIGGFLLAAVLLWVTLHNKSSRKQRELSERSTRDLYEQEEAGRRQDDGEV